MNRLVYATTTQIVHDEYTCEWLNNESLKNLGKRETYRCGYSPVQRTFKKVKYKDANWMG